MQNIRRLLHYYLSVPHVPRRLLVSQLLLAIAVLFELAVPQLVQTMVDDGIAVGDLRVISRAALYMVIASLAATVFYVINAWYATNFSERAAHTLRTRVYQRIQSLSFGNLDRFETSDLLVRLTADVNAAKLVIMNGTTTLLRAPFMILGAVGLLLLTSPGLAWIMVLALLALILILALYTYISPRLYQVRNQRLDEQNLVLQENLAGVRVVKAFVRGDYENQRYHEANDGLRLAARRAQALAAILTPSLVIIVNLGLAAALWFGGSAAIDTGAISVGEIMAFTNYMVLVMLPMVLVAFLLPQISAAESSLQRIRDVGMADADIQDRPGATPLTKPQGRVVFENVSFSYLDNQGRPAVTPVLKNINFTAEPGEMVAILGATGSGKSSLVNLIPRFYDVTEGRVTIDGIDVRDYSQSSILQHVTPVLQKAVLFSGSVRDNILFGAQGKSDEDMIEAATAADAHSFVSARADGYDAEVKRQGANFSGGQKQRVSIARAVVRKPKILILDDSTSALDVATETRVQGALADLMHGATTFVVAQRISTVLIADKIIVLDNGEIAAYGSHEELLATSPLYQEIYRSQLGDDLGVQANG